MKNPQPQARAWVIFLGVVIVVALVLLALRLTASNTPVATSPPPPPPMVAPPPAPPPVERFKGDDRVILAEELAWLDDHSNKMAIESANGTIAAWNQALDGRRTMFRQKFGATTNEYQGKCRSAWLNISLAQGELFNYYLAFEQKKSGGGGNDRLQAAYFTFFNATAAVRVALNSCNKT